MEEQCRRIDSQDIDASIDLVGLNNLIVKMRSSVKKAKVQVIHKLCRTMKQLKNKKGTDDQVTKNKNKADRLYEEVTIIKDLPVDKVSKFSLANTATFDEVCKNPKVSTETRTMTRLACCQAMQKDVATFRKGHEDWESLAKFLIYKQTGRRYKKTRTKAAGSQAMKEMVVKQHGGSMSLEDTVVPKVDVDDDKTGSAEESDEGSSDEGSSDEEGSSNKKSDEESNSGVDIGSRVKIIERKEGAENVSESEGSKSEGEDLSESEDLSENMDLDAGEITGVCKEPSKLVDERSEVNAANRTGEKSDDPQTTVAEKQTINVYNQRLKHLNIFTVKEDGEVSSDEDDSSSENVAKDRESSPENVDSGGSDSESGEDLEPEGEDIEGRTSDTDDSSSGAEKESDSSASAGSTGDTNLVPDAAKAESVAEVVKKTKLIGALSVKPGVDSKGPSKSSLVEIQKSKTEMKKSKVKKTVSPRKMGLVTSAAIEKGQVQQDVIKPKKEPVNVKKGTMVIQKLDLDVDDADDIAVSAGDDDSGEEDVPDFLLGSIEERREKREARDMFFMTEDGEEDERDMLDDDEGNGNSSGVEEEDAEMTHHRGRQMIESVFVGALSKPETDRSDRNEGFRNFRGGRGRGGRDSYDRNEGQRGFHGDSYRGRRGSFQDRGRRGSYHDRDGHRGSFQGRGGNRGSFQGRDGGQGGFRGHHGGDRGSSMGRGGGRFQQTGRGGDRYSKPYENKAYEHSSKKPDDKSSKAAEKVHPSWEASRKRKEQAASIKSFQGKKIKFDDSD